MTEENKTICLTMIIKNESKIIERCLNACKTVCDYMAICDTGSDDNTVEIVETFFSQHPQIKGFLHHHEWKDFGHNRSLSLQAGRETGADYLLCIDADMILEVQDDFDKSVLVDDSYMVLQRNTSISYYNTRLMRARMYWHCVGVTHEYYDCEEAETKGTLKTLTINDIGDGGCKDDKYERDIRLLTQGLIDEPDNVRYMFYLAQSYKDTGQYEKAIEMYKQRIEKGGWFEEVWYSHYMLGECYRRDDKWEQALSAYLGGYEFLQTRAENIYSIAKYYRENGDHNLSYVFCKLGSTIPYPENDVLFIDPKPYSTNFLWEISVISYYLGKPEMGLISSDKLIHGLYKNRDKLIVERPFNVDLLMNNRLFYTKSLSDYFPVTYQKIDITVPEGWLICNPSIIQCSNGSDGFTGSKKIRSKKGTNKTKNIKYQAKGYLLAVRSINYITYPEKGEYEYPFGHVDTTTYIVPLDIQSLSFENTDDIVRTDIQKSIKKPINDTTIYNDFIIKGFEDIRIFTVRGEYYATGTARELSEDGKADMVLLPLDANYRIKKVIRLESHEDDKFQKNWMPFIHKNKLHFVYMCTPLTIIKPDLETGKCTVVKKIDYGSTKDKYIMEDYRGGSRGVPFNNGYLFIIHETTFKGKARTYTHRFIFLDSASLEITRFSPPFYFKDQTVEFVLGMEKSIAEKVAEKVAEKEENKHMIITLGYQDKEAHICKIKFSWINNFLMFSNALKEWKIQ